MNSNVMAYLEEGLEVLCPVCDKNLAEVIITEPLTLWCQDCGSIEVNEDFEFEDQPSIEAYTKNALKMVDELTGVDTEQDNISEDAVADDMLVELYRECGIDVEDTEQTEVVIEEPIVEQPIKNNECSTPKNVERVALNMKPTREFKDRLQQHAKATGESMSSMVERVMGAYIDHCNKGK